MPQTIAVSTRAGSGLIARVAELLTARWGWVTGRVPVGVTPTLPTSRRWFN